MKTAIQILLLLILSSSAFAFSIDTDYNLEPRPELVIAPGVLLPFGIVGVRDTYPMIGLYYSNKAFTAPKYEIGLFSAKAKDVSFYTLSLGYKIDVRMYETVEAFINFGVDAHYYKRKPGNFTDFPFVATGGAHFGFGSYHEISRNTLIRADFKFNFGPGKAMFVGIALAMRWDEAEAEAEEAQ